jgi:hypothetical protein
MVKSLVGVVACMLATATAFAEDRCVEVKRDGTALFAGAGGKADVIGKLWKGAVLEVGGTSGDQVEVYGYVGESRYVKGSAVQEVPCKVSLPPDESARRAAFRAALAAERRAVQEGIRKFGEGYNPAEVTFERLLMDKYDLAALRTFKVDPYSKRELTTLGARGGWDR